MPTFWHIDGVSVLNPTSTDHSPLTIRRIILWTLYVAVFAAIFSVLPATSLSFNAASAVAFLFVAIDGFSPSRCRLQAMLATSFFACGLAYAVATGFIVLILKPPPVTPKPPLPFWSELYHLVSGGIIRDTGNAIAETIATVFQYGITIIVCTMISSLIALFTFRRRKQSKWLLLLNSPWQLLSGWFCVVIVYEILTDG